MLFLGPLGQRGDSCDCHHRVLALHTDMGLTSTLALDDMSSHRAVPGNLSPLEEASADEPLPLLAHLDDTDMGWLIGHGGACML